MNENKFTDEIIKLIDSYFKEEKISKKDLEFIFTHCSNYILKEKDRRKFSNNFMAFKVFIDEEIKDGDQYRMRFNSEDALKDFNTVRTLKQEDIKDYIDNSQNMDVFFGDDQGKLLIEIGKSSNTFDNSNIKKVFDEYSTNNNPKKHPSPQKITVPFADLIEVYNYMLQDESTNVYFQTAVSLSNDDNYKGRIIIILVCDTGNKVIKYYDTFQICPPDGC